MTLNVSPTTLDRWKATKEAGVGRDKRIPAPAQVPANAGQGSGTPGKKGHGEVGWWDGGVGGEEGSPLCHSLSLCSAMLFSGFSFPLCVSLSLCLPDPMSLLPLCLSLLCALLLLPLLLSPAPSLIPIIEFSLDCGCPFFRSPFPPSHPPTPN